MEINWLELHLFAVAFLTVFVVFFYNKMVIPISNGHNLPLWSCDLIYVLIITIMWPLVLVIMIVSLVKGFYRGISGS